MLGPGPVADRARAAGPVGEDGVRHRALQTVVVVVGRRADLDREHERPVIRKGLQMIPRLLHRHHGRRAAGVADVGALDIAAAAEARHEVRVQARRQATRARGGGQEVEILGCPIRPPPGARRTAASPISSAPRQKRSFSSSTVSRPSKVCGVEVEIAALDIAVTEETQPRRVRVPRQAQDVVLSEARARAWRRRQH